MKITIPNPNDCSGLKVGDKVFVMSNHSDSPLEISDVIYVGSGGFDTRYGYSYDFRGRGEPYKHAGGAVPATPAMIAEWERERAEWRNGVLFDLWMMIKDIDNNDAEQIAFAALLGDDLLKAIETKLNSRAAAGG